MQFNLGWRSFEAVWSSVSLQRYLAESDLKVDQFLAVVSWCWGHPTGAGAGEELADPTAIIQRWSTESAQVFETELTNVSRRITGSLPTVGPKEVAWGLLPIRGLCQVWLLNLGAGKRVPRLTKPLCYLFSGPLEAALVPRGLCLVSFESLSALLVR